MVVREGFSEEMTFELTLGWLEGTGYIIRWSRMSRLRGAGRGPRGNWAEAEAGCRKMGPRWRRELGNRICAEILFISVNYFKKTWKHNTFSGGFSGGTVAKNLPANAGNKDSISGLGRFHMSWSCWAPDLEPKSCNYWSPCTQSLRLQQEKPSNEKPLHPNNSSACY